MLLDKNVDSRMLWVRWTFLLATVSFLRQVWRKLCRTIYTMSEYQQKQPSKEHVPKRLLCSLNDATLCCAVLCGSNTPWRTQHVEWPFVNQLILHFIISISQANDVWQLFMSRNNFIFTPNKTRVAFSRKYAKFANSVEEGSFWGPR